MIDFELYKLFYTVAKYGSLSKAATELYISQPAASQSVRRLEQLLDTPLFNRLNHGMELSAQGGKIIFDDVEQAVKSRRAPRARCASARRKRFSNISCPRRSFGITSFTHRLKSS